jgi:hypothetical protein
MVNEQMGVGEAVFITGMKCTFIIPPSELDE